MSTHAPGFQSFRHNYLQIIRAFLGTTCMDGLNDTILFSNPIWVFGIISSGGVGVQCRSVIVVCRAMCFLLSFVQFRDVMVGPKNCLFPIMV